jgi:hypothetical protein
MQVQRRAACPGPLGIAPPRLDMVQGMDLARAGFRASRPALVARPPAPQDQARALLRKLRIQAGQRMVQPPARSPAHAAVLRRLVIEHIDRDHRAPRRGGSASAGWSASRRSRRSQTMMGALIGG